MGYRRATIAVPLGIAALVISPAFAQEVVPDEAVAVSAEEDTATMDKVVVTAALREQSLQDVPIAVSVLSAAQLEATRSRDFTDLANLTPNFAFDKLTGAGFVIPALRGIGAAGGGDSSLTSSPAVGIYVDGVYVNAAGANLFNVLDVERVEVLRGPQGTLYGRNALAGVVNIVSKEPGKSFEGTTRLGLGNFNSREGFLSLSGPLAGENVRGRASVYYVSHDGYTENRYTTPDPAFGESSRDADDLESLNFRSSLLVQPWSGSKLLFSADYSKDDTTYPGYQVEGVSLLGFTGDGDPRSGAYNADNGENAQKWGASLRWDQELGRNGRLVSISGYRNSDWGYDQADVDGTPDSIIAQFIEIEEESFSQELRYLFTGARFDGVLGAYFYDYSGRQDATLDFFGELREMGLPFDPVTFSTWSILRTVVEAKVRNYAAFGNFDWQITDRFSAGVGARYSSSRHTLDTLADHFEDGGQFYSATVPWNQVPGTVTIYPNPLSPRAKENFSKFTPRVVANYDFNDDVRGYLSWSQGYRDGGFSTRASTPSSFGPELLTAYEVGLKTSSRDGRFRLNSAAYYYDYEDQQIDISVFDPFSGTASIEILNAAESVAYGVEFELYARPSNNFDVTAALGYQQTEFRDFTSGTDSREGNEFPRSPNWNATVSPQYTVPLVNTGSLRLRADLIYRTKEFTEDSNDPVLIANSRTLVNASATFRTPDDRLGLSLWGKNLTDEEYAVHALDFRALGYVLRNYGEPRTFGVTLSYAF